MKTALDDTSHAHDDLHRLCREVALNNYFEPLGALLDLLEEVGDPRRPALYREVGLAVCRFTTAPTPGADDPLERQREVWWQFLQEFYALFWPEIHGGVAPALAAAGRCLLAADAPEETPP